MDSKCLKFLQVKLERPYNINRPPLSCSLEFLEMII